MKKPTTVPVQMTVVDLVAMVGEIGSDGAAQQLNTIVEEARTEGYNRGVSDGSAKGREWSEWRDRAKTALGTALAAIPICAILGLIITQVVSCNGASAKEAASRMQSCKSGDYGYCLAAYKHTLGQESEAAAELYSRTYKEATGKDLIPPPQEKQVLMEKTNDGYLLKSKGVTVEIKAN